MSVAEEEQPVVADDVPLNVRSQRTVGSVFDRLFVPGVLLLLVLYLSLTDDAFFSQVNLINVLQQASILAIVSFGATFVIVAGQLDLSSGTGSALISVIGALVMVNTGSIVLGLLACLGAGLVLGLVNGLLVTVLEVPSFIATLGTMIICGGIALAVTDGGVVTGLPSGFGEMARLRLLGLPILVWATAVVFLLLWWLQRQSVFGYQTFAVGGNAEAARLSGIPVNRIRLLVFVISGLATAAAAIALLVRVQSGQPNANATLALEAIAAVVVGGTSLTGGRGSVVRTLWGVLLIATLRNGLDLIGFSEDYKQVVLGVVFILAASVDFLRRQLIRRQAGRIPPPQRTAPPDPDPPLSRTRADTAPTPR